MVLCPWVSYLLAEVSLSLNLQGLELSGIVTIFCNSIFLSKYASHNLSSISRKVLKQGYDTLAYTAETFVFLFLGAGMFSFR